ncbi:MAG: DUF2232 domain-containing protein [Desulfuromonadales bacterium]|nr:MAG: DUF2232 domain-containing protein [Desulfuromonadales bacterium]
METGARQPLLDIAKGGAMTAAIMLVSLNLPLLGIGVGIIAPFPALYYDLKWGGVTVGAAIVALTLVFLAVAGGPAASLLYLFQAGIPAVALAAFLSRGMATSRAIAFTVLVTAVLVTIAAGGYSLVREVDPHGQFGVVIRESMAQTLKLYEGRGISGEDLNLLKQGMEQVAALIGQIFPVLFLIGQSLVTGINVLLLRRVSDRLAVKIGSAPFSRFRNPDWLVWGLIASGFVLLLDNAAIEAVALNVLVLSGFLYFVQGMAVVLHIFTAYAVPTFFRFFFYVLLVLQAYLVIAVALLGLFDLWGNFRRPRIHKNL